MKFYFKWAKMTKQAFKIGSRTRKNKEIRRGQEEKKGPLKRKHGVDR